MHPDSEGAFTHEDSKGHRGRLAAGDLQWMSAARGIMHSEVPESRSEARGLQMWLNLPRKHKMDEPTYQEFASDDIPTGEENGIRVRVIAGEALGVTSPVKTRTAATFYHFTMEPNTTL